MDYGSQGHRKSDMTERLSVHAHMCHPSCSLGWNKRSQSGCRLTHEEAIAFICTCKSQDLLRLRKVDISESYSESKYC